MEEKWEGKQKNKILMNLYKSQGYVYLYTMRNSVKRSHVFAPLAKFGSISLQNLLLKKLGF